MTGALPRRNGAMIAPPGGAGRGARPRRRGSAGPAGGGRGRPRRRAAWRPGSGCENCQHLPPTRPHNATGLAGPTPARSPRRCAGPRRSADHRRDQPGQPGPPRRSTLRCADSRPPTRPRPRWRRDRVPTVQASIALINSCLGDSCRSSGAYGMEVGRRGNHGKALLWRSRVAWTGVARRWWVGRAAHPSSAHSGVW
jgi:hypothetical protein